MFFTQSYLIFGGLLELELLDKAYLDEQIMILPWTTKLKNGRLPAAVGKDGKERSRLLESTRFPKVAYPMLECILEVAKSE